MPPRTRVASALIRLSLIAASILAASCGYKAPPMLPEPVPIVTYAIEPSVLMRADSAILAWTVSPAPPRGGEYVIERDGVRVARTKGNSYATDQATSARYDIALAVGDEVIGRVEFVVGPWVGPTEAARLSVSAHPGGATLRWAPVAGAGAYNLYDVTPGAVEAPVARGIEGTVYELGADHSKAVSYAVRATRKAGDSVHEGPPSVPVSISPVDYYAGHELDVRAVRTSEGVTLTWRGPGPEWRGTFAVYRIQGEAYRLGEARVPFYRDADTSPGPRAYRVGLVGPDGREGPLSPPVALDMDR